MIALLFALLLCSLPSWASPQIDSQEQEVVTLINDYRIENGRGALTLDPDLSHVSTYHSGNMVEYGFFGHTDQLGRTPSGRLAYCGYTKSGNTGENLALVSDWLGTPEFIVNGWRNSPGHNFNLLYTGYQTVGISREIDGRGVAYWTLTLSEAPPIEPPKPLYRVHVGGLVKDGR